MTKISFRRSNIFCSQDFRITIVCECALKDIKGEESQNHVDKKEQLSEYSKLRTSQPFIQFQTATLDRYVPPLVPCSTEWYWYVRYSTRQKAKINYSIDDSILNFEVLNEFEHYQKWSHQLRYGKEIISPTEAFYLGRRLQD